MTQQRQQQLAGILTEAQTLLPHTELDKMRYKLEAMSDSYDHGGLSSASVSFIGKVRDTDNFVAIFGILDGNQDEYEPYECSAVQYFKWDGKKVVKVGKSEEWSEDSDYVTKKLFKKHGRNLIELYNEYISQEHF